ncbi:hypothetical protein PQI07_31085 [Methylobacterium sp. 092160098-2]|nr:hypothetical protein [Methylobacterium sp. 092160098-2]MDE4915087.1 hypothetical protein [Methylobacterium sp. 092160098-2]
MIDLDPPHEGTDDLATARPVEGIQPGTDPIGERLQAPDYQL